MGKSLVLAGGGHAHMMILAHIRDLVDDGHRVTVIQPSEHHYYSGMGPGMLGGTYTPDAIRFSTRFVVERQGGMFVQDKVTRIDTESRTVITQSAQTVGYDVLSCNTGSFIPFENISGSLDNVFTVKPIERLQQARRRLLELCAAHTRPSVAVVGGGPAALEIAGNAWKIAHEQGRYQPSITLYAGRRLLGHLPPNIRRMAVDSLDSRGIAIEEKGYVQQVVDGVITRADGSTCRPDLIFIATGVQPSGLFEASGIPVGPHGGMHVNRHLQSIAHPEIFGGGDCIHFGPQPLDKVGVYAVRENPVLLHNVRAALAGRHLRTFDPGGGYLLLFNLGDGTAIFRKGPLLFRNKVAMWLKDYIDTRFMDTFQALEN